MTQPSRWGFARLARWAVALGTVLVLGAGRLAAQGTTGKIEGTVRDQAGAPIAGAQVLIVGSAYATVSNEQGYYFFNGVPAGVVTVRAQYIGYAPAETRNVRVFAGQTMTINLALEQRAIEVGGITVTVEQNPIVPRDQVTSKPIIAGDLVQELPADNITAVLRLQPGVVEGVNGISIRGGRPGEQILYIDGVPVRSVSGNVATNTVGTNAAEEVSVTTGAIGAQQGDAQSGVISIVTRSGGSTYSGFISYETDELASDAQSQGLHRFEASFGGPIMQNLTFFVATTMSGQQNGLRGLGAEEFPTFVANGIDTTVTVAQTPGSSTSDSLTVALPAFSRYSDGQRLPNNWSNTWNVDAKVQYSYGTGSRLSATYHRTRGQGLNFPGTTGLYNQMGQTGFLNNSNMFVLNWAQNLARSSERALFLDAAISYQKDQGTNGLVDQDWWSSNRDPNAWFTFSDMEFMVDWNNFPVDDRLVQNLRVNNCQQGRDAARPDMGGCIPYLNRNDLNTGSQFRINPYGIQAATFPTTGLGNAAVNLNEETRWTGRVNLDWQADRYNRIQVGGDFVSADAKIFTGNLISQIFMDANIYSPSRIGLYVTDRLDLGDVVVDLGLRYDRMSSGVLYPRYPGRVFTDPARTGDTTNAQSQEDRDVAERCSALLAAADTTGWSTCNMFEGEARSVLLPSIRVSFPVTDRTGFRLSYAQQAQAPNFNLLATGVNADLAYTNTNDVFGRELDYGKSIIFEFGIRHAFSQDMVLDVSAYNKDKVSDVTARILPLYDPFRNETQNLNLMTNADFGNSRGIDVKLDRRVGQLFQGSVAYTFQTSKSTGSDPFEYLNTLSRTNNNVTGERAPPPQALLTTTDNRTHTLAGSLALNFPHGWGSGTVGKLFQDFGAFATFRFASGLAYTRMVPVGSGTRGPANGFGLGAQAAEPLNASTTPWIKNVDLRLTKGFRLGGTRDLTVYADFRNLFNWENILQVYAETGDINHEVFRESTVEPIRATLAGEAGSLVRTRVVTLDDGSSATETGVDLSDCSAYRPTDYRGTPDCIMLRRAESRWGDGDQFFSIDEQNTAFGAWFDRVQGPYSFKGAGMNFRLGLQFNF